MSKKKAPNKLERQHMHRVAALGCIICRAPAEVHHLRMNVGMGQRASHFDTIPLCAEHHRTGGHGIAIHAGARTFAQNFGTERELLEKTNQQIEAIYGE